MTSRRLAMMALFCLCGLFTQEASAWYDSQMGRWLTRDPIGYKGGDTNLYGFVRANPCFYVDPSGLANASCKGSIYMKQVPAPDDDETSYTTSVCYVYCTCPNGTNFDFEIGGTGMMGWVTEKECEEIADAASSDPNACHDPDDDGDCPDKTPPPPPVQSTRPVAPDYTLAAGPPTITVVPVDPNDPIFPPFRVNLLLQTRGGQGHTLGGRIPFTEFFLLQ